MLIGLSGTGPRRIASLLLPPLPFEQLAPGVKTGMDFRGQGPVVRRAVNAFHWQERMIILSCHWINLYPVASLSNLNEELSWPEIPTPQTKSTKQMKIILFNTVRWVANTLRAKKNYKLLKTKIWHKQTPRLWQSVGFVWNTLTLLRPRKTAAVADCVKREETYKNTAENCA